MHHLKGMTWDEYLALALGVAAIVAVVMVLPMIKG